MANVEYATAAFSFIGDRARKSALWLLFGEPLFSQGWWSDVGLLSVVHVPARDHRVADTDFAPYF